MFRSNVSGSLAHIDQTLNFNWYFAQSTVKVKVFFVIKVTFPYEAHDRAQKWQMWHACVTCTCDMVFVFLSKNSNTRSLWHAWHVWHAWHTWYFWTLVTHVNHVTCVTYILIVWKMSARSPWHAWHTWHAWHIKGLDFWPLVTHVNHVTCVT